MGCVTYSAIDDAFQKLATDAGIPIPLLFTFVKTNVCFWLTQKGPLTIIAEVIHQYDFMDEVHWGAVQHTKEQRENL